MKHLKIDDSRVRAPRSSSNGSASVPALGLGTFELEGEACRRAVRHGLDLGYRHIDTAQMYGNEEMVGKALADSGVDRDEVFLTTKIWWEELAEPARMRASVEESLRRLGTERVDLLLIHWPHPERDMVTPLETLAALAEEGKAVTVGVSNFPPDLLELAVERAPVVCNQVEYHPYLAQDRLLELARRHDLFLTAYSPLARGRVMDDATLRAIGEAHGKSPAQVTLRWHLQQDRVAAIPKAASPEHREANFDVLDFELSEDEMRRITNLARGQRLIDPEFAPAWGP